MTWITCSSLKQSLWSGNRFSFLGHQQGVGFILPESGLETQRGVDEGRPSTKENPCANSRRREMGVVHIKIIDLHYTNIPSNLTSRNLALKNL